MNDIFLTAIIIGLALFAFGLPLILILWSKLGIDKWFKNSKPKQEGILPWKARIDEKEKAEQEKVENERLRIWQREFSLLLREHQKSYKCQCFSHNLPSDGPVGYLSSQAGVLDFKTFLWDCPKNLRQCGNCFRWTCERHLHKGICEECYVKMKNI